MYYVATGNTMEEMKEDATKYFNSQIRSLGWGRITTLIEIRPMRSGGEPPKVKKVKEEKTKTKKPLEKDTLISVTRGCVLLLFQGIL